MAELSRLPQPIEEVWEWQYKGACRDKEPEMFFHPDGERGPRRRNRENAAKAVCASCPVIQACRDHALAVAESLSFQPHRNLITLVKRKSPVGNHGGFLISTT